MVAARQLDYLVEADLVELANLLLVDPVNHHDELVVSASPAVLLAFPRRLQSLALSMGSA
jgi:hypothetical protein